MSVVRSGGLAPDVRITFEFSHALEVIRGARGVTALVEGEGELPVDARVVGGKFQRAQGVWERLVRTIESNQQSPLDDIRLGGRRSGEPDALNLLVRVGVAFLVLKNQRQIMECDVTALSEFDPATQGMGDVRQRIPPAT